MQTKPRYSVVIPFKNEEDNIADLVKELEPVMDSLTDSLAGTWELICIEDGSTDRTRAVLLDLASRKSYIKVLLFTKNFGQTSAFDAGFQAAQGDYVITLDGDRQNDPADIPKLLALMPKCDLVCGYRARRKDPLSKKITSWMANKVRSRFCGDNVRDSGCSLKVYRRECLIKIKLFHGMHRFLPTLFIIEGFSVKELPVNHRPRIKGKTKYNFFNRSFNTIMDLLAVWWMRKRKLHYSIEKDY